MMTDQLKTPTIRKGRKFDQVLEGARTIFMRDGFEGASVDDIAREAGVSKATLYSYFPDKRLLFMEVAKSECNRQADEAVELVEAEKMPVAAVLRFAAERFIGYMSTTFALQTYRICVAEADRFPQLGHEFYHSGPELVRKHMVDYLRKAVAKGELQIEDFELAADQFAELCKADIHNRLIFGVGACCAPKDRQRIIDGAVEMFLARYGVRG